MSIRVGGTVSSQSQVSLWWNWKWVLIAPVAGSSPSAEAVWRLSPGRSAPTQGAALPVVK